MSRVSPNEYIVVRFGSPIEGNDPDDGYAFIADRHKVAARWARQDPAETVFIDDLGEIVARWPTGAIRKIEWPTLSRPIHRQPQLSHDAARTDSPTAGEIELRIGTREWKEEIQRQHPMAYQRWTNDEDVALGEQFSSGLTVAEMSALHQRMPGGIKSRLIRLGLVDPADGSASET